MRNKILLGISSSLLFAGACKWTEFDDLRDEAWVNAITKPDGSKSTNWGVAVVRGKAASPNGATLAVFGSASSRLNEFSFSTDGTPKNLEEQNLGNIGIDNLSNEPIVLASPDPASDEFALVTQGNAQNVVVAAGQDSQLRQFLVREATSVDGAAYLVAPALDGDIATARDQRTPQAPQPIVVSGDRVFGTFYTEAVPPASCRITVGGAPVDLRGVGAVKTATGATTDDVALWTANGDMVLLDGSVFNGDRSGAAATNNFACGDGAGGPPSAGTQPVLNENLSGVVLGTAAAVGYTPGAGTMSQILTFGDHFAILQGHDLSSSFLALWDFTDPGGTAGAMVGAALMEPGLRAVALYQDAGQTFVVAGYPDAVIDGVAAGKVVVFAVDTTTGINAMPIDTLHDSQPEDGQAFGRSVAVMQFNGQPVLVVGGNNEVYTYFRTPHLYNSDRRQ